MFGDRCQGMPPMCALRIVQTMAVVPLMNAKPNPPGTHVLDPAGLGDHLDRLYRSARALCRSREAAEDLVQDTYARVLSRPRFLRNDDDLGYLLRVLLHTFIDQRRRSSRRPALATPDQLERVESRAAPSPEIVAETR